MGFEHESEYSIQYLSVVTLNVKAAGDSASSGDHTGTRNCPTCAQNDVETPVERYRDTPLNYCTYHYWLMRAEPRGTSLNDYVKGSEVHTFKVSLPTSKDLAKMKSKR